MKEGAFTDDDGFVYSRWGSPTNEACARQIYALEGADERKGGGTLLFGSGMSGITSAVMSVLKAGDHCVFPYTGKRRVGGRRVDVLRFPLSVAPLLTTHARTRQQCTEARTSS
jgi:cystathionine beta-lyase/cystathionine gamma-synthase